MVMPTKQQEDESRISFVYESCGVSNLYVKIPDRIKTKIALRKWNEYLDSEHVGGGNDYLSFSDWLEEKE